MRNFESFEEYCKASNKQSNGIEKPETFSSIPRGFVTMEEINAYAKTLPKYTSADYVKIRNNREHKRNPEEYEII